MIEKVCPKCQQKKTEQEFHRSKRSKDGLQSWCKECKKADSGNRKEYKAQWYEANKERVQAYKARWHQANKDRVRENQHRRRAKILAYKAQYRAAHREELRSKARERYAANRSYLQNQNQAYARLHCEESKERSRLWRLAHPQRFRAKRNAWRRLHLVRHRANNARWRNINRTRYRQQMRHGKLLRRLGKDSVAARYAEQTLLHDPCCYCGKVAATTIDHIQAVSKGGTNQWDNLTAACASCNSSKGDKSLLIFLLHRKEELGA